MYYISQFTTDTQHIRLADSALVDAPSRYIIVVTSSSLDYTIVVADRSRDAELEKLLNDPVLQMKRIILPGTTVALNAEVSTVAVRL